LPQSPPLPLLLRLLRQQPATHLPLHLLPQPLPLLRLTAAAWLCRNR
jgi:hypothetical protein